MTIHSLMLRAVSTFASLLVVFHLSACNCCDHGGMAAACKVDRQDDGTGYTRVANVPRAAHWPLYEAGGKGPPVIILHDLIGPRPQCLQLGRTISQDMGRDYHVYIPVIYGRFGEANTTLGGTLAAVHRSWQFTGGETDSPILPRLKALCAFVSARHGGQPVMVIGNCLTGGAAIGILSDPHVCGVIASQPAAPYFPAWTLDLSPATLVAAKTRAPTLVQPAILAFRYDQDPICRPERFKRLRGEFQGGFDGVVLCEKGKAPPQGLRALSTLNSQQHSVLIPLEKDPFEKQNAATHRDVLREVAQFLDRHAPR